MKSSITKTFRQKFNKLPKSLQKQAKKAYILWRKDCYHPRIQFKKVSQKQPIYSVRIDLNYRVLGLWEKDTIYWYWIGTHGEYDEFLKKL